jgi:hypothetical protein
MIREYILLSDGLSVANINFTLWSVSEITINESAIESWAAAGIVVCAMPNRMCTNTGYYVIDILWWNIMMVIHLCISNIKNIW